MRKIKLGMIGMSAGNGHPYSWSAIINGYNAERMQECPFPVIPQYLAKEKFPEAAIAGAEVTHIWTQEIKLSQHIADATYIPNVVEHMEQMIPEIDAVLLARDDADNHITMAKPFLEAGLPIYIDKPLVLKCLDVELLFSMQKYPGQIFTCSAFQYARELMEVEKKLSSKKIIHIDAHIKNDWNKYAIHLIEPIIKVIGHDISVKHVDVITTNTQKVANYLFSNGLTLQIKTFITSNVKPTLHFFSEDDVTTVVIQDAFFAFKAALEKFLVGIRDKQEITQKNFVMRSIELLESATMSKRCTYQPSHAQ
ncbi:MAG: Gfo/Idh/MocA family oxidoreductase [Gammaproteobacteria bacterium]|nr:Gfo/Idh/MocA family oxidoreductase [Gammaproteobacteria bacterium]